MKRKNQICLLICVAVICGLGISISLKTDSGTGVSSPAQVSNQASEDASAGNSAKDYVKPVTLARESVADPTNLQEPETAASPGNASTKARQAVKGAGIRSTVLPRFGAVEVIDSSIVENEAGETVVSMLAKAPDAFKYPLLRIVQKSQDVAPEVMIGDHVIVQFDREQSDEAISEMVAEAGLTIRKKMLNPGLYVISAPEAGLDSVPDMLETFEDLGIAVVGASEPDFLAYSQAESTESEDGYSNHHWDAGSAVPAGPLSERAKRLRIESLSSPIRPNFASTRTIRFDPPFFPGGADLYAPYAVEQKMRFAHPTSGVRVEEASATQPDNGSFYVKVPGYTNSNGIISHAENLPFTLHQMDVAEARSTSTGLQFQLIAIKADGTQHSQTYALDGVADGEGPLADFETLQFGSEFENVTSVRVSGTSGVAIDNAIVTIHGSETPEPPAPSLPLVYDIDFSEPVHRLDQPMAVGGYRAPKTIRMGNPIVRAAVGALTDQPVELKLGDGGIFTSSNYEQVLMGLELGAEGYRFEMDLMVESLGPQIYSDSFTIHFDSVDGGIQRIDFEEDNDISIFQSGINAGDIGHYVPGQKHHLRVDADMVLKRWEIFLDGNRIHTGAFGHADRDVRGIRVHFSDSTGGDALAAVDNIKIYAFEPGEITDPFVPELHISPTSLDFGPVSVGSVATRRVRLSNTGFERLAVASLNLNQSSFAVAGSTGPFEIEAGGFRDVDIQFSPASPGAKTGSLQVLSNDPVQPSANVSLAGTGLAVSSFSTSAESISVEVEDGESKSFDLILSNSGSSTINWNLAKEGSSSFSSEPPSPDDPGLGLLWGLRDPDVHGAGIAADKAWGITTGASSVVVGVIDTGVEWNHPELAANIWQNRDEIAGNGIDDDNNGFIDDVRGWDFYSDDANPTDPESGHGTHVAGTIAASGSNGIGIAGVAWQAQIMPIRFLGPFGGTYSDGIDSIDYATQNGARITNNSWGGGSQSSLLQAAISRAMSQDSLFVAAAGNDGFNADQRPMFPAAYPLANIISVAATDRYDGVAYFSNYGSSSVDIGAPGVSIYSTFLRGGYRSLNGTSMASPHVAGAAVLLRAQDPRQTFLETKARLLNNVDVIPSLTGKVSSNGRLNVFSSLGGVFETEWLTISPLSGSLSGNSSQTLTFDFSSLGLTGGRYTEILTLTSNDPLKPVIDLPVVFDVGVTSNSIGTGPLITVQPEDREVNRGENVTLSVTATTSSGPLQYQWYEGETGAKEFPVGGNSASLVLSNVIEETSYWVEVSDSDGSVFSTASSVTLLFTPDPPLPPTNVTASDGDSETAVTVTWAIADGAETYHIYRNTADNVATATKIGESVSAAYLDLNAEPFRQDFYWVFASNAGGESDASGSDTGFRTIPAPLEISASGGSSSDRVTVSWTAVQGATIYRLYRADTNDENEGVLVSQGAGNSFIDLDVEIGNQYYYWVEAATALGSSHLTGSNVGFTSLDAPVSVTATDGTSTDSISIAWDSSPGAEGYEIYRMPVSGLTPEIKVGESTENEFVDEGVVPGLRYRYRVKSFSNAGGSLNLSAFSGSDTGHRQMELPESFSASDGVPLTHIELIWDAVEGASSYWIQRSLSENFSTITTITAGSALGYWDSNTEAETVYYYRIRALSSELATIYSTAVTGLRHGGDTWDDYKEAHQITDPAADPDGDGFGAFEEYVFGGSDPDDLDEVPSFHYEIKSFEGVTYLTLSYLQLHYGDQEGQIYSSLGNRYKPVGSSDLKTWDYVPVAIPTVAGLPSSPDGYVWHSVRLPFSTDQSSGYLKVEASLEDR